MTKWVTEMAWVDPNISFYRDMHMLVNTKRSEGVLPLPIRRFDPAGFTDEDMTWYLRGWSAGILTGDEVLVQLPTRNGYKFDVALVETLLQEGARVQILLYPTANEADAEKLKQTFSEMIVSR
jgi:hypothetical protein